ncbi:MAG TPA: hypothetical protein ENJ35_08185 [Gammaproteobacteria bacterium]|nr:hypothetical protein [Gammaproteobacteria bacterium]
MVNFRHYARHDPGVDLVEVYIAVNQAQPKSRSDEIALQSLVQVLEKNPKYKVRKVEFFNKPGRDWRALYVNLNNLLPEATDTDFLFFNNRSGTGALEDGWYKRMLDKIRQDNEIGGVASTMWLPSKEDSEFPPHLQAFGILTRIRDCLPMMDDFPGIHATDSDGTIRTGEVRFSERLLENGRKLASLYQPLLVVSPGQTDFGNERTGCPRPEAAVAGGVPFSHRAVQPYYLAQPEHWAAILWWWVQRIYHQPSIASNFPYRTWMALHWFQWHIRHRDTNSHA